tara:strand:- start:1457 stop:1798 length:342 start_codon:yes stop_codon:yes gene_type:complete
VVDSTIENYTYSDLKIIDDDLVRDEFGQPVFIYDRDVVDQDIRHSIRESGLLEQLIGERSPNQRKMILSKLRILIESDPRVIPGTSEMDIKDIENFRIIADTDFGKIHMGANV